MNNKKIILHLDINYFYAQVEEIINPYYKDKSLIVVSSKYKGIVLTSNYIARRYGIKAPQKVFEAQKLHPELMIVTSKMDEYKKYSQRFFTCIREHFTPELECYSTDECYLDATPILETYHNNIMYLVNDIYQTVLKETGLKISIGIGENKFLAKTANDISSKQTFYNTLYIEDITTKLYPCKISDIFFVGKSTAQYFKTKNIHTVKDFMEYPYQDKLALDLKSKYNLLYDFFTGKSSDVINAETGHHKTFSLAETFLYSTNESDVIKKKIITLSEQLFQKIMDEKVNCHTFTLSLRDEHKKTTSRSITLHKKIINQQEFANIYIKLLNKY